MRTDMPTSRLPLTANFHFIKSCNYRCRYCYATFAETAGAPVLPDDQVLALVRLLARTYTKVTLAGGEPTLYRRLPELLTAIKEEGALTNLVTNGSRITPDWIAEHDDVLDFLTLSIDSVDPATHRMLGRAARNGAALPVEHCTGLADAAKAAGVVFKVNTVVTTVNARESVSAFIHRLNPQRWKILQAAPVPGQNDEYIGALTPPRADFDAYVDRHLAGLAGSGIRVVAEPIDLIRGSYIMVDPQGRFFDSTAGTHTYSRPILQVGLDVAFAEVDFNADLFLARGGDADWRIRPPATNPPASTPPALVGPGWTRAPHSARQHVDSGRR
jgi:radical S-adenosyl methionine domain-containing protein 2